MTDSILSYSPIEIANSPVEFVVIGLIGGQYRPIIASENCGLDLIGFAAARGDQSLIFLGDKSPRSPFRMFRRSNDALTPQILSMRISSYSKTSNVLKSTELFLFWKGPNLSSESSDRLKPLLDSCFSAIMNEIFYSSPGGMHLDSMPYSDSMKKDVSNFVSWHIAPVISTLYEKNIRFKNYVEFYKSILLLYLSLLSFSTIAALIVIILRIF